MTARWLAAGVLLAVVVSGSLEFQWPPKTEDLLPFLHLLVPVLVLVVEVYMLGRIDQEHRERRKVMEDLDAFRISMGRGNYMLEIERAIAGAQEAVVFTSATMQTSWRSEHQARIVEAVKKQKQRSPNYTHRGIVAKRVEALPGTIELLCKTDIEVRMSDIMSMSRLRFVVRDFTFSVIGVAEGEPSLENQPETKRSFSVTSTMLASALRAKFDELWNSATDPWAFLNEIIAAAIQSHPNYTRIEIGQLLGLNAELQKEFADKLELHCSAFKSLPKQSFPPTSTTPNPES